MLKRALSRQFSNISQSSSKLSDSCNVSRSTSPTLDTDIDSNQDLLEMLCSDVFSTNIEFSKSSSNSQCGSPISSSSDHYSDCIECQIEEILSVDDATALSCMMEYGNLNYMTPIKMPSSKEERATIFHRCVDSLAFHCTRMLLGNGQCNVNAKTSKRFETALHLSVRKFKPGKLSPQVLKMIEVLLEAGAEINSENYKGRTPLHMAAWRGSVAATKLLCEAGARLDVKDSLGNKPIDDALRGGAIGMLAAEVLLSYDNPNDASQNKTDRGSNSVFCKTDVGSSKRRNQEKGNSEFEERIDNGATRAEKSKLLDAEQPEKGNKNLTKSCDVEVKEDETQRMGWLENDQRNEELTEQERKLVDSKKADERVYDKTKLKGVGDEPNKVSGEQCRIEDKCIKDKIETLDIQNKAHDESRTKEVEAKKLTCIRHKNKMARKNRVFKKGKSNKAEKKNLINQEETQVTEMKSVHDHNQAKMTKQKVSYGDINSEIGKQNDSGRQDVPNMIEQEPLCSEGNTEGVKQKDACRHDDPKVVEQLLLCSDGNIEERNACSYNESKKAEQEVLYSPDNTEISEQRDTCSINEPKMVEKHVLHTEGYSEIAELEDTCSHDDRKTIGQGAVHNDGNSKVSEHRDGCSDDDAKTVEQESSHSEGNTTVSENRDACNHDELKMVEQKALHTEGNTKISENRDACSHDESKTMEQETLPSEGNTKISENKDTCSHDESKTTGQAFLPGEGNIKISEHRDACSHDESKTLDQEILPNGGNTKIIEHRNGCSHDASKLINPEALHRKGDTKISENRNGCSHDESKTVQQEALHSEGCTAVSANRDTYDHDEPRMVEQEDLHSEGNTKISENRNCCQSFHKVM